MLLVVPLLILQNVHLYNDDYDDDGNDDDDDDNDDNVDDDTPINKRCER